MELVSVILPTYNRAKLIQDAVRSVIEQTFPAWELIVVDDGSTDNTENVLAAYFSDERVRYIRKKNGGAASARNKGIEVAKGDFIAFIDSDDVWQREKLSYQMEVFRRHPEVGIVCSDFSGLSEQRVFSRSHIRTYFSVFRDYGLTYDKVFKNVEDVKDARTGQRYRVYAGNIYETMVFGNLILTSTSVCRRTVFGAVGSFDTKYSTLEDYDLLLKMARMCPVAFIDLPLITYRYNAGQLSGEGHFEELCLNLDEIFEKNIESVDSAFIAANKSRIKQHRGMIQRQLGYYYFHHRQRHHAARYFLKSLVHGGANLKGVVYLMLCFLPNLGIDALKRIKDWVGAQKHSA